MSSASTEQQLRDGSPGPRRRDSSEDDDGEPDSERGACHDDRPSPPATGEEASEEDEGTGRPHRRTVDVGAAAALREGEPPARHAPAGDRLLARSLGSRRAMTLKSLSDDTMAEEIQRLADEERKLHQCPWVTSKRVVRHIVVPCSLLVALPAFCRSLSLHALGPVDHHRLRDMHDPLPARADLLGSVWRLQLLDTDLGLGHRSHVVRRMSLSAAPRHAIVSSPGVSLQPAELRHGPT